mmetsp:Transcript_104915/g.338319  ORF Transcript_104915/g.338319 Transcript_104915/m.338319 type:complete len:223 (+) Transcript_104915:1399-2067(+)
MEGEERTSASSPRRPSLPGRLAADSSASKPLSACFKVSSVKTGLPSTKILKLFWGSSMAASRASRTSAGFFERSFTGSKAESLLTLPSASFWHCRSWYRQGRPSRSTSPHFGLSSTVTTLAPATGAAMRLCTISASTFPEGSRTSESSLLACRLGGRNLKIASSMVCTLAGARATSRPASTYSAPNRGTATLLANSLSTRQEPLSPLRHRRAQPLHSCNVPW